MSKWKEEKTESKKCRGINFLSVVAKNLCGDTSADKSKGMLLGGERASWRIGESGVCLAS